MSERRVTTPDPAWIEVKRLAADALELPRGQRRDFVRTRSGENTALHDRVMALVRADEEQTEALSADSLEGPRAVIREIDSTTGPVEEGEQVGRYRVVRLIGSGGMGAVYEARDDDLGRDVALKVVVGSGVGLAWSASALRRFALEAKALARLTHPGIAQIHESGTHRLKSGVSAPYLILELVQGGMPITAWTKQHIPATRDLLALFARVCDAVAHGHHKGVIHRDLKPANILIDSAGDPKLIDFGVARTIEPEGSISRLTREGQIVGTIQYMSPEQCAGDADTTDVRSDVYSLGVVLHELLAGDLPYDVRTGTLASAASTIRDRPPRPLGQIRTDLAGDIERIVLKALEKDPGRRYQSVSELAGDLRRFLAGEPIIARPPSAVYQLRLFARRHRALVAGAVAAVACLSLGVVGTTLALLEARQAQAVADEQSQRASRLSRFFLGMVQSATASAEAVDAPAAVRDEWSKWLNLDLAWDGAGVPGNIATVPDLLRKAIHRLPEEFGDDPLLYAEAGYHIVRTINNLGVGLGPDGYKLAREVAGIYERELGVADRRTIVAHTQAATLLGIVNDASDAADHQERAMRGAVALLGPTDPRTTVIRRMLIQFHAQIPGKQRQAAEEYDALRSEVAQAHGVDSDEVALADLVMADLLARTDRVDEAIALCERAVDTLRPHAGKNPGAMSHGLFQLAHFLAAKPEGLDAAEAAVRESIEYAKRVDPLGGNVNENRFRHILILMSLQRFDEAEVVARESLAIYERLMPPDGLNRLKAQARVASILIRRRDKLDEARRLAQEAGERYERTANNPDEDFTQHHFMLQAAAIRLLGRPQEALALVDTRLAHRLKKPDWQASWASVSMLLERGRCLTALKRYDEAEHDLLAADNAYRLIYGDDSTFPTRAALGEAFVTLYESMGRSDDAAKWAEVAFPRWAEGKRSTSPAANPRP